MAISPPSDLILDVARAVDPLSYSQAAEKLARMGSAQPADGDADAFAELMDEMKSPAQPFVRSDPAALLTNVRNNEVIARGSGPAGAYEKFEAFVLQSFLQSMLPESSPALFGSGTSGEVWRSMLAEQLGAQLAKSGGIGVAERIAAANPGAAAPHAAAAPLRCT